MATTGIASLTDTAGAAAAVYTLSAKLKQLAITNTHATQTITVRVSTANTSAAAAALAAAGGVAVIGASENITVAPGKRVVLVKSNRSIFTSISAIASGAATTFTLEGTIFKDGQ